MRIFNCFLCLLICLITSYCADFKKEQGDYKVEQIINLATYLTPVDIIGKNKKRYGQQKDGGYVLVGDYVYNALYSYGVGRDIGFEVAGLQQSLLKAERLVLNIVQRMSGIASETRRYADEIKDYHTKILDTRKTTPGFRVLEKEAVRIGGGVNHRMGLYDMIMLKDNHVDFAGGIKNAIQRAGDYLRKSGRDLKIEIEARSIEEVKTIVKYGGIDRIMLDNFSPEQTREAVKFIAGRYETESSGGITFNTLKDYAACGVDYISVGALTHQIKSLDISLKAV